MRPVPVSTEPIAIVGLLGGQWFGRGAEAALRGADVLIGHAQQFDLLARDIAGERVELWGDLGAVVDHAVEQRAAGRRPCILAAGDPGFHGMVRFAAERLGEDDLAVHPAPSSVALAFARVGTSWDDAAVASAHAQSRDEVVATVIDHPKVAVRGAGHAHRPRRPGRRLVRPPVRGGAAPTIATTRAATTDPRADDDVEVVKYVCRGGGAG